MRILELHNLLLWESAVVPGAWIVRLRVRRGVLSTTGGGCELVADARFVIGMQIGGSVK